MDGPFPQPNEAIVTFFDEDGYEFKVTVQSARDEAVARDRAHADARQRIVDGQWRPHGTLVIGGLQVNETTGQKPASQGRHATAAAWRATAAPHLQGAIAELERAAMAMAMPMSRERLLVDRALRATARVFRECTHNLELARRHLGAAPPDTLGAGIGAER